MERQRNMRVLTWNINGIRATNKTSCIKSLLTSLEADIVCLQETKITRSLLPEDIANVDGYYAFFSFSRKRGGYSGVVTYCKKDFCPVAAEEGLSGVLTKDNDQHCVGDYDNSDFSYEVLKSLDGEGRAIITEHKTAASQRVCIVNVYCPRADVENEERYTYKMNFYSLLESRCKSLRNAGKHTILVGDLNVSHKRIDNCDPNEDFEKNVARIWLNGFLGTLPKEMDEGNENNLEIFDNDEIESINSVQHSLPIEKDDDNENDLENLDNDEIESIHSIQKINTFVDIFREYHPHEKDAYTCWNTKTRARETNYGTRIDYIIVNREFSSYVTHCNIRPDILGSDHCPVQCDVNVNISTSKTVPGLCAIFMPELSGKQVGITSYFTKKSENGNNDVSVAQKRSFDFPDDNSSKSRKLSCSKGKRNNMLNYFKSNSKPTGKSTAKLQNEDACKKTTKDLLSSDEIWHSANYITKNDSKSRNSDAKASWKGILKGPDPTPLCSGHNEKSVVRTVKKEGANFGRQFYVCSRPAGSSTNKKASCEFFQWKK